MAAQSWFERGAESLGAIAPNYRGRGYACPICLRISPSDATLTVEDVPPKSVGGRPLILTCKSCNDAAGATLDWHWSNFSDAEGFGARDLSRPITVNFSRTPSPRPTGHQALRRWIVRAAVVERQ
jgi:hypothetical protein